MISEIVIGPFTFHLYGLILGIAILAGWWWAKRQTLEAGMSENYFEKAAGVAILFGLVGARLYHIVDYWKYYQQYPLEMLMVWNGGLGIWGAVLGGVLGIVLIYTFQLKTESKNLFILLDAGAWAMPLAQAIGRWGNWVNSELFGKPTSLFWGVYISPENRPAEWDEYTHFHPLFWYESGLNLLLFGFLNWGAKRWSWKLGSGKIIAIYGIGYGLIRLILENFQIRSWMIGSIPMAQIMAVISILMGATFFVKGNANENK